MDKNKEKLELLSETFSKIFNEPIKFIERTIDVAKDFDDAMNKITEVDINNPPCPRGYILQKKLDRAENFYNALKVSREVLNGEIEDIFTLDDVDELEVSINWNTDATAMAIADCLGIDHTRDDYFNIFYDAITKGYGFEWMIEKLKKEEVV